MKPYLAALAVSVLAILSCAPANAACTLSHPAPASPWSNTTRLDTMTSDSVLITGGCVDGVTIAGNAPVNWAGALQQSSLGTIGNYNSIWTTSGAHAPTYLQRLFIGPAAAVNTGNAPESPKDWLETLRQYSTQAAQFVSLSPIGQTAATFGTRTSDYTASVTNTAMGISGYAMNDNTSFDDFAYAGYLEARRYASVNGLTTGLEIDTANLDPAVVAVTPNNTIPSGGVINLWLGGGAGALTPSNSSAAIAIDRNTANFYNGIVFGANALDNTQGSGGNGIAMSLSGGQALKWWKTDGTDLGQVWGDANGIHASTPLRGQNLTMRLNALEEYASNANAEIAINYNGYNGGATQFRDTTIYNGKNVPIAKFQGSTKHELVGTAAPSLSLCGTSPAISGSDVAGEITMGTGTPTSCTLTFNVAYTSAPYCTVTWQSNLATMQYAVAADTLVLTQTATSSNKVNYHCLGQSGG